MPVGKLRPNTVLKRLWQYISVDFIIKLLVFRGHDSVLVVCNRSSKILHCIVIAEKTTTEGLTKLFRDNIWKLHRLPKSVISDRGP